jgi:iron complex outermembrane receptor protein
MSVQRNCARKPFRFPAEHSLSYLRCLPAPDSLERRVPPPSILLLFGLLFFFAFPGQTLAAPELPLEDGQNPEEIIVTATRNQRPLSQVPMSVTVLTRDEILDSPAQAVDDLLRIVPGVNVPAASSLVSHPTSQSVSMRGLGRGRALVLLDGVPLNDGFGGWVNWTKIPYRNIDRIEVVRGGSSSVYGTYAMGGVINVLTRPAEGRAMDLEASYGTQGTGRAHAYVSESVGDTAVSINYDFYDSDGYPVVAADERGPVDTNAHSQHNNLQLEANHSFDSGTTAYVRTNLFRDKRNVGTPLANDSRDVWDVAMGTKFPAPGGGDAKLSFFSSLQDFDNANTTVADDRASEKLALTQEVPSFDIGAAAQWSRELGFWSSFAAVGMDFRHVDGENRETIIDLPPFDSSVTKGKQDALGIYAEMSLFPWPQFEALASLRFDYWSNYAASRAEDGSPIELYADRSESEVSPRLSLRYEFESGWAARGAVYRAFRAPSLNELYRGFYAGNAFFAPNADLSPEILRIGGELGIDYRVKGVQASLTGFWNELDNAIAFVGTFGSKKRQNIAATRSRGFEFEFEVSIGEEWALAPSYVFTEATIQNFPSSPNLVGNWIEDIPRHQAAVTLTYDNPDLFELMIRGRYVGKRYSSDDNDFEMQSFGILDISASKHLGEHLEIFLMVENLLDEEYDADRTGTTTRIGAPRQVWGGLRMQF